MSSSEQQDDVATAPVPAADGAPRATRPRRVAVGHVSPAPSQATLIDEALGQVDHTRTAILEALGRDTGRARGEAMAAGHLRAAFDALDQLRSHLASGRALAR